MERTGWSRRVVLGCIASAIIFSQGCVERSTPSQPGDGSPADLPGLLADLLPPPDRQPPRLDRGLCGNGVLDPGEACDGTNLGGNSCASLGLMGKLLACRADCTLDSSRCGWLKALTGTGIFRGRGIAAAPDGGAVVVGGFTGSATLGKTKLTSRAHPPAYDMFVARITPAGEISWALSAGGTGHALGKAVALDKAGNILVTGWFSEETQFGPFKLSAGGSQGWPDLFVLKISPAGKVLWAVSGGGSAADLGFDLAVDAQGNATIAGDIAGPGAFGGIKLGFAGTNDILIARISPAGKVLWAKTVGDGGSDHAYGVATDSSGYTYLTGYFTGKASFGNTKLTGRGSTDIFVSKLNSKGGFIWTKHIGGKNYEVARDIALDGQGSPLVAGEFTGTLQLGGKILTSSGKTDLLLIRLSPKGTVQWAVSAGGSGYEAALAVAAGGGRITLAGSYGSTVKLGATTLTPLGTGSFNKNDLLLAGLDAKGTVLWAGRAGSQKYTDSVGALAMDSLANTYMTGTFIGRASFAGGGFVQSQIGGSAAFIWKFGKAGP